MLLKASGFKYSLEFWLGGKNILVSSINKFLSRIISIKKLNKIFWKPIKYFQLWIFGGVLNLFATKNN